MCLSGVFFLLFFILKFVKSADIQNKLYDELIRNTLVNIKKIVIALITHMYTNKINKQINTLYYVSYIII